MASSVTELLSEIAELSEPLVELNRLKAAVNSVPLNTLRELATGLRFGVLFNLLESDDREQIDVCVAILERFLQSLEPICLVQNYKLELQKGLQHSDDRVKTLALTQIGRISECADAVVTVLGSPEFIKEMIHSIGSERISIANELVLEIANMSPVSLEYCVNGSFVTRLLSELSGDDVLIRATAIEMVTTLAQSQHGRQYLAQQGIIDRISNMIIGAKSDPFSSFYLPNLVKFFGNLAMVDSPQQICERYPVFVEKVFEMIEGQEPTMIGVGLDTIGILGSCIEGKQVLNKTGTAFQEVLRRLGSLSCNASTDMRLRCLDTIASLLSLQTDQQTEDILGMTESWFHALHSRPMETFRSMSSQPFPDIHIGALKVFTAIASQPWGQRLMIGTPGFVEYIVDRSTKADKNSKDAKFELVKALVNSKSIAEIFGNQHYLQLRAYLQEGPYFVKAVAVVAVEGGE
ncbi:26S proteasome non-ATPase regulatory subunit 5 isoform X2 [Narcine bancroftii]|uniref:26S proteasome non-ATPase regulatory subunit 5 isoform X2 n=1 Tax=Narcine bancroftii TaxID=1343680 RepID=UPI0038310B89